MMNFLFFLRTEHVYVNFLERCKMYVEQWRVFEMSAVIWDAFIGNVLRL
jgi:hypothetical protein